MKLCALLLAAVPLPVLAQYALYACGSSTKDYVVGVNDYRLKPVELGSD